MASYNFYLKDKQAKSDTPIYLLFDDGVNRGKFYIQLSINPKDWNREKGEARKSLNAFSDFNGKLEMLQGKCKELHTNLTTEGKFSLENLKTEFKNFLDELNGRKKSIDTGDNKTFDKLTAFALDYINSIGTNKSKNTIRTNRQTLRLLNEFETAKRRKITFEKVNLDFYNDFIDFLTATKKQAPNTIGKHIANLKMFLNEAKERGYNTKDDYKSRRFKTPNEKVDTIYLSKSELQQIEEFDFSGNKRLDHTRDLFLIGCWTGLRFSDFSQLTSDNIHDGVITIRTQKTDETVKIAIHPTVNSILKKYADTAKGLPRPISNQKMNQYLKEIGKAVGLNENEMLTKTKGGLKAQITVPKYELMTTHTARRSFATNLYLADFPSISIMKITGHKTEKAFMRYIRISHEENAEKLRLHWAETTPLRAVRG